MKFMRIILFAGLLLVTACFRSDESEIYLPLTELSALEAVPLSASGIVIDSLLGASIVKKTDSWIVVADRYAEKMIEIYDGYGKFQCAVLASGNGPGETTNILDINVSPESKLYVTVADEKVFVYNLQNVVGGEVLPETILGLPPFNYAFSSFAVTDTSLFYVGRNTSVSESNETLYCQYNIETGKLSSFGQLPKDDDNYEKYPKNDFTIQTIYQGKPERKPDGSKIVLPFFYMPGFEIVDLKDNQIVASKIYQAPGVEVEAVQDLGINVVKRDYESYVGFIDCSCNDEYIYFLYSGKKFVEPTYRQASIILKYDWTGKLLTRYKLDKDIIAFCSDGPDSFLCIVENETRSQVVKYTK